MTLSVIMPVFNAVQTLRQAVDSVLSQQVELELLLVDDGSTDGSTVIAEEIAAQDSRVAVLHQSNQGICAARNAGLEQAKGEYVTFCDDDDEVLPGAYAHLLALARSSGAQIVRGGYRLLRQHPDGSVSELFHKMESGCTLQQGYGAFLRAGGPQFVWNVLYRRDALHGVQFDERCRSGLEDFLFNATLYATVDSAVFDPRPVYCHTERLDSASRSWSEAAMRARAQAVPLWLAAEYRAVCCREQGASRQRLWNERRAQTVTFLMHMLRDGHASRPVHREAWNILRQAMGRYPRGLRGAMGKQALALLLFELHLQNLYELMPNREEHR